MKFGKLFTKLIAKYPQFATLSNNKFSLLTYAELRTIARELRADGYLVGNYTHDPFNVLANKVYNAVKSMQLFEGQMLYKYRNEINQCKGEE